MVALCLWTVSHCARGAVVASVAGHRLCFLELYRNSACSAGERKNIYKWKKKKSLKRFLQVAPHSPLNVQLYTSISILGVPRFCLFLFMFWKNRPKRYYGEKLTRRRFSACNVRLSTVWCITQHMIVPSQMKLAPWRGIWCFDNYILNKMKL